jgi:hypothetical protein
MDLAIKTTGGSNALIIHFEFRLAADVPPPTSPRRNCRLCSEELGERIK